MKTSDAKALGYLVGFTPPVLAVVGGILDLPALGFVTLVLVFPFLRAVFGDVDPDRPPEWSEPVASALHVLPFLLAAAYLLAFPVALFWAAAEERSWHYWLWWGLSLWSINLFGSCVAHELLHRNDRAARLFGRLLAGVVLYPLLEHDHRSHHRRSGDVENAEWPAEEESVWRFSARRFRAAWSAARLSDLTAASRAGNRLAGGMPLSVAVTGLVVLSSAWMLGVAGVGCVLITGVAVAWALHAMTYIQHWGLSDGRSGRSWEDLCQLQAWLTLNLSFHQAHHDKSSLPYYWIAPAPAAPRAPAGYVILFFASLVPSIWFHVMRPALQRWKHDPATPAVVGRRLVCVARPTR